MVTIPRNFTRMIPSLLLGFALGMPLRAQLDPKLQGSSTDLLDLYQQSKSTKVKPEIVTIFDFSASMQSLMYHPCYPIPNDVNNNGDTTGITFSLSGSSGSFVVTATVGPASWGYSSTRLIRPDGTAVTEAIVNATPTGTGLWGDKSVTGGGSQACDVRNWVRCASHIRITSGTRTIDLPIPWKVMDKNSTGSPLTSMTVKDEVILPDDKGVMTSYGSKTNIEIDTRYKIQDFPAGTSSQTIDNNRILSGEKNTTTTKTKYMLRLYKPYLVWIFTGKYQSSNSANPDYNASYSGKYIIFDAANASLAGGQMNVGQGQGFGTFGTETMVSWDPILKIAGTKPASDHAIPARDRVQAVKEAAIRTWIQYQTRVFWAYRFLDDEVEALNIGGNATATTIDYNSAATVTTGVPTTWANGQDTGWTLFNGQSLTAMNRLAALFPYTNTPLCYAMARALAQFTDPNNVFKNVETGTDVPKECQNHYLILFTDGIPTVDMNSEGKNTSPYLPTATTGTAEIGNASLIANTTMINPGNSGWNIFTLAGAAAHLADTSLTSKMTIPTYPSGSAAPSSFLPFAIPKRGTVTLIGKHRLVTTMTVGVSLGGSFTATDSPKRRLFLAAALGDPNRTEWNNLSNLTPYTLVDSTDPGLGKTANSTYFFDATDPDLLIKSLGYAFLESLNNSNLGVTSSPNLPFIGASSGKQIYIGKFQPPEEGGVFWDGDLLMFPTKVDSNNKLVILNKTGAPATTLDSTTAGWSAAKNLPLWSSRKLFTRIPNTSALSTFTYTGTPYTDATNGLKNFVAAANTAAYPAGGSDQQALIKKVMGADPADTTKNRKNIMGDIINSSPMYLEYSTDSLPSSVKPTGTSERFRLILVGTNQGWLHAFGETSSIANVEDPSSTTTPKAKIDLVSASVKELWAFLPTDFLNNLDYLGSNSNSHTFLVDGSPSLYFLDLPPSAGGRGNGKLDGANITITPSTDTTHERAIAIIGLRKGGRSYYAINLHDPTAPTLQWSLVPDEYASIPASRNKTGLTDPVLQGIVKNMGYSTCTPSFGRVMFNGVYKDVVFLGGGLSLPEIEAKFTGKPLLGRSVMALDVNTGDFLAAVDLTSSTIRGTSMIGPVPIGLVPFEFFLGSGMAQRAYFLDMWGGLWCWGSKKTVAAATPFDPYTDFRLDTSELQAWSKDGTQSTPYGNTGIRKVYQDANATVTANTSTTPTTYTFTGPMYTTAPSPFLVGNFPGKGRTISGNTASAPVAVGIAMESGNRNNPLDYGTNNPANTRLTVIFDRQDSRGWGLDTAAGPDTGINTDAQLLNAGKWKDNGAISATLAYGNASISPGNATYYLAPSTGTPQFGYYVTFPDAVSSRYSKGINTPLVVDNTLYYSYFTPTSVDACSGGSGYTYSNMICDVLNPVASDTRTDVSCQSGKIDTWFNLASDFSMLGTPGVQQVGTRSTKDTSGNTVIVLKAETYLGATQDMFPRPRVWRTVR